MMEEISSQLGGQDSQRGRARYEKSRIDAGQPYRVVNGISGGLEPKEYAKLKAQIAIERRLRQDCEADLEALKLKTNYQEQVSNMERYETLKRSSMYKK